MCQPKIMRPAAAAVLALTLLTAGSASAGADVLQRGEMTGSAPAPYRPCTEAVALTLQSDFAAFMTVRMPRGSRRCASSGGCCRRPSCLRAPRSS